MFNQAKLATLLSTQSQRSIPKEPGSGERCRGLSAAVEVTPPHQVTGGLLSVRGAGVQQL